MDKPFHNLFLLPYLLWCVDYLLTTFKRIESHYYLQELCHFMIVKTHILGHNKFLGRYSRTYMVEIKSRDILIYFKWIKISILYLHQIYINTFFCFMSDENVFPNNLEKVKGDGELSFFMTTPIL